ncbi:MAG: bifunctional metallophosphatase/5'-nucleotidase [Desulfatiglandales bacterium]
MGRVKKRKASLFWWMFAAMVLWVTFDLGKMPLLAEEEKGDQIRIIATNDIHYYLKPLYYRFLDATKPWGTQSREGDYVAKAGLAGKIGGMAHVATVIKRLKDEMPGRTLLVDVGDTWYGSALSHLDRGQSMVKIMNAIGYQAMVPGNWDYYYPKERFLKLVEQANFSIIALNLTDKEWEDPVLPSYVIKKVGRLKVALVGVTYPWTGLTSSAVGAAQWWNFGIKEKETKRLIKQIRKEEKPDLVVVLSHMGYGGDQKFTKRVDGIDILVSGHTHDEVFDPVVWNDTIIFQAGAHGKFVASLDLEVRDGKVKGYDYRLIKVNQDRIPPDPEIAQLVEEAYHPYQKKLNEVVGRTETMLYRRDYWQSTMGNFLTDTLREMVETEIAFFPAWRFGATLLPGEITVEDVYNIVPPRGHIFTYSMRGKALKMLLENILDNVVKDDPYARVGGDMIRFSGLKIRYDLRNVVGSRIVEMQVNGKPLDPERAYTIASVQTRFQNNLFFGAFDVKDTWKVFVEELLWYIREHSPIFSTLDDRIKPSNNFSQRRKDQQK